MRRGGRHVLHGCSFFSGTCGATSCGDRVDSPATTDNAGDNSTREVGGDGPSRVGGVQSVAVAILAASLAIHAQHPASGDLEGIWNYATMTPLERPRDLAAKATLTPAEAAEYERRDHRASERDQQHGRARLVGSGHALPDQRTHVADRRSDRRPRAGADRRGAAARGGARAGAARARPGRRPGGSRAQRTLPQLVRRRAADAARASTTTTSRSSRRAATWRSSPR